MLSFTKCILNGFHTKERTLFADCPCGAVVTHLTCNEKIRGSNPRAGSLFFHGQIHTYLGYLSKAGFILVFILSLFLFGGDNGHSVCWFKQLILTRPDTNTAQ